MLEKQREIMVKRHKQDVNQSIYEKNPRGIDHRQRIISSLNMINYVNSKNGITELTERD